MTALLERTEESTAAYRELVDLHAALVKVSRTHEQRELNKVISDGTARTLRAHESERAGPFGSSQSVNPRSTRPWRHRSGAPPSKDITVLAGKACHSIISSASARIDGGTFTSRVRAVRMLTTSSIVRGYSTGMSPGFVPRRMRSTNVASSR